MNTARLRWPIAFMFAALSLSACEGEPNLGEFATNEIEAVLKVLNTEPGEEGAFEVTFLDPQTGLSPNYIKLTEEAALTATWGDSSVELEQVTQGVITYGAPFTVTEATEFNIAFTRPDGEDAPINTAFLAAPFEITDVSSSVAPGGSVDIVWSGGSGSTDLLISGDCIASFTAAVDMAEGAYNVPFESLTPIDPAAPTACSLSVQMNNESESAADAAWNEESVTVSRVLRRMDNAVTYQP
ncbi:MAG: hypothetical protein AB8H79_23095 [Myxococcota bacterium]